MTSKKLLVGFLSLALLLVMGEAQASNYQSGTQSQIQSLLRLLSQISHTSLLGQVSCPGNPPTVSFSSLGNFVYPTTGAPVSFSLTGTDPEGGALQYAVDFSSDGGWTPYQTSAQFSKTFSWESGQLFVKAYAKDSCGNQSAPSELVFWPSNNPGSAIRGPVARLLGPTAISVQQMANLSAEAIDDISNANLTYTWSKYSGPGTVTFSNPNSPNTSATVSVAGSYRLKFKAHDGQISSSNIFVDVNFAQATSPSNQSPTAQASVTPTSATDTNGNGTEPFNFSSSGSNDPDGSIVSYSWKDNDQQISTQASPSNVLLSVGPHSITLTVTDNGGLSATSAAINVTVYPGPCSGNQPPVAAISGPSSGQTGSPLNFSGTGSNDPGGSISGYAWNSTPSSGANIASPTSASTNITFTTAGTYSVRLTVTDNCGDTDFETKTVTITNPQVNQAPNVNAGTDLAITLPTNSVNLNATVTDDGLPLGRLLSYAWTKESGPGTVNFSSPNTEDSQATFSLAGTYILKLTVTEILSGVPQLSGSDTVQITVNSAPTSCSNNQAPTANAGPDQNAMANQPVTLSGSASSDPDGQIVSYWWNFGDGQFTGWQPNAVVTHSYAITSTYTVRLWVRDSCGAMSPVDTAIITVGAVDPTNEPPQVNAGTDQTIALPAVANLDGTIIDNDADGLTPTTLWTKVSGPTNGIVIFGNDAAIDTSASFSLAGSYVLRLTATDGPHNVWDEVMVTVNSAQPSNTPPTVNAGTDQTITLPTDTVTLNATVTDDGLPLGRLLSYAWTKESGPGTVNFSSPNTEDPQATFSLAGIYNLKLTVTEILNLVPVLSGFGTTQITVNAANPCVGNQPPTAAISGPSSGQTGSPLNFSGTGSTDPNGNNTIASYSWNFGNGQSSSSISPSVTYATAGTYQVTLTVTDSCGAIGETTRSVAISNPASNELPIADADPDYQSVTVGAPASFNGSASYDPDGSVVSYWWNFGDGSSTGWQTSPFAEHAYITTGSRTVTLWVKDNSGATSASNAVNVSVGDTDPCAGNTSPTANAGLDRTVVVNTPATFSSTGSTDSDGTITSYAWTFGDESSASGAVVSHIYTTAGTYTLKLIVTDNCEAAGQDTAVITVTNPPVGELNADFRVYRLVYVDPYTHEEEWAEVNLATEIVPIGTQLKFDSSASTGDIGFATWTMGDGTFETGTVVQHQYENGGTFPVELTIFDTTWQYYDTVTKSITLANTMTFLDSLGLSDDNSIDIVLHGSLAWTTHMNNKLTTVDITNPADLVMVSSITAPSARAITYANGHLFLAGSLAGMHIYEATTPNPTSVGVYSTWSQDGQIVRDVYGQGKVVIMAAGSAGLKILDVSNPASPQMLNSPTPLPNNTSAEVLVVSNGKVYVADGSTKVHIYDVSGLNFNNPSAFTPTLLKTINVGWIVHQLAITGNTLIAQANPGGMFLYDVTNPASATQIGYFDIADEAVGLSPGGIVASGHYVYAGFGPVLGIGTSVAKVSLVNPANPYIAEWLSTSAYSVSGTNRSPVLRNGVLYFANSMHRAATVGVGE